ncbi:MAG: isocitrate/isopropylmalate dehydrogenase family protein [Planctomycetota bacterium]
MQHKVVLIPGDGIGPEVAEATQGVIAASGADIDWVECHAGIAALEAGHEDVLPQETVDTITEIGVALKSPCTTPIGKSFVSVNVRLRKTLDLYGAVRPVRSMSGVKTRYEDVDLIVVRENTEGLYCGIENVITPGVVTSLKIVTEKASTRIARFAFQLAKNRGRKKVTAFHKANIMKKGDGLFIECARNVHDAEFPEIEYDEHIIDAACMRLVQEPSQYDILLCPNFYGDIVSDLCAGLIGGLGVSPGSNFGDKGAVFEAVHGSAPDIAGQNKANPLALIKSAVMMLRHMSDTTKDLSLDGCADKIRSAYDKAIADGEKTGDLGGKLGTREFADALIRRL